MKSARDAANTQAEKRVAQAYQHFDWHMLARREISCSSGACDPAWVASGIAARLAGWRPSLRD